jgi:hypothetical protein
MKEIKYIYFEVNRITGYNQSEKNIENINILLIQPHTNSDGYWGFTNLTERHGFSEKSYNMVVQHWIDLEKYNNSGTNYMREEIDIVLESLKKLL